MDDMNDSAWSGTLDPDDRAFVLAVVRRIVPTPEDAEDVTQEALLSAYRHRASFRGESHVRSWLYRIAVTAALGHLRRARRARIDVVGSAEDRVLTRAVDPGRSADDLVGEAQACEQTLRALDELAPSYRDVLLARVDATEPEVAARLGISVANVKIRTHRARKQLRATLDRDARGSRAA